MYSWTPRDDPDKPSLPYFPGFNITIYAHRINGAEPARPKLKLEYLQEVTQSEAVTNNPSQFACSTPNDGKRMQLVINTAIRIGLARGPQIVSCTITPFQDEGGEVREPFEAVAKIYDPLYYNFLCDSRTGPLDCLHQADQDYKNETAAYEHLRKHGQTGSYAPEYYGSWMMTLPISINRERKFRNVHLVLIEKLNGVSTECTRTRNSMDRRRGTDSFHYPEHYRLEILARAMDGFTKQLRMGLQGDFRGENVILVPADSHGETICGFVIPRIVLIDYSHSRIIDMSSDTATGFPSTAAALLWNTSLWETFGGWVPNEWIDLEIQQRWLLQRFNEDDELHQNRHAREDSVPVSAGDTEAGHLPTGQRGVQQHAPFFYSNDGEDPPDPVIVNYEGPNTFYPFEEKQKLFDELMQNAGILERSQHEGSPE